jgi:hypothetical protein
MKRLLCIAVVLLAGCETPAFVKPLVRPKVVAERPTVNVPLADRQENWLGPRQREGSCTWASAVSLLRWQGRYAKADFVRKNYGDGEWPDHWAEMADKAGIRYAMTTNGDVAFLEWACRTRRGCNITIMGGAHMVTLVHFDSKWAAILDNNSTSKFKWIPRESLVAEWHASHGWAVTPVYAPMPPLPQR